MVDRISKTKRSANMKAIKSKDMKPEITVRRLVHGLGYRYRLHRHDLPGRPDLVFPSRKKIIFVHGCFWHQHSDPRCPLVRKPKSRLDYWLPKLDRTVARDKQHTDTLRTEGWEVLTVWECEIIRSQASALSHKLCVFLDG